MSQYSPPTYHTQTNTTSIIHRHLLQTNPKSHPPNTTTTKHIHTQLTHSYLINRLPNNILDTPVPEINPDFSNLPRHSQISLARLRCGHHPNLQQYKHKFNIKQTTSPTCTRLGEAPENVKHFLLRCPSISRPRISWGITTLEDLWTKPTAAGGFISEVWPPQHGVVRG